MLTDSENINNSENVKIYSLFSGSSGNCTYFRCGNDEFLIDAGCSMKAVNGALEKIGTSLSSIKAIFITHEHIDHIQGCAMIAKHYRIPIHTLATRDKKLLSIDSEILHIHSAGFAERLGDTEIKSFATSHDATSACGYSVCFNGEVYGVSTDTGYITNDMLCFLKGAKAAVVEANYDCDMLRHGTYSADLKHRVFSKTGHLSNDDCAVLCSYLAQNGAEHILLAHLSENNNTPSRALSAVIGKLREDNALIDVRVANRHSPTLLYDSTESRTLKIRI